MVNQFWNASASVLKQGGAMISTVSQKLDESGVTSKVTTFVSSAADKTVEVGSKLYIQGSEKF